MPKRRKREAGDGSIYFDRSRGLWIGELLLPGCTPTGARKRKRVSSVDRDECARRLREALHDLDHGVPLDNRSITVRQWIEKFQAEIAPYGRAAKSAERNEQVFRDYVLPYVGDKRLAALSPDDVRRMMRALESRPSRYKRAGETVMLSPNTVARARACLSAALTAAQREELISRNVVRLTDPPKGLANVRRRRDAMSPAEVELVLDASAAGIPEYLPGTNTPSGATRPDRLYPLAELVLAVGMRQGECLDLRWSELDLKAETVRVLDAKTPAGKRHIPIPSSVAAVLREHRKRQRIERLAAPVWADNDLVFPSAIGTRLDRRNVLRWWHLLTTRAGVGRRRFHATRHTAATVMLNRGAPIELVSAVLGHARTSITEEFYAEPDLALLRTATDRMEGAYRRGAR